MTINQPLSQLGRCNFACRQLQTLLETDGKLTSLITFFDT